MRSSKISVNRQQKRAFTALFLLRNILDNTFGRGVQKIRVADEAVEIAERYRIGVSVGNALITGDAIVDIGHSFDASVCLKQVFLLFSAEGEKYRNVAEII